MENAWPLPWRLRGAPASAPGCGGASAGQSHLSSSQECRNLLPSGWCWWLEMGKDGNTCTGDTGKRWKRGALLLLLESLWLGVHQHPRSRWAHLLGKENWNRKATFPYLFVPSNARPTLAISYKTSHKNVCVSQETDRIICSTNVLHQADQTLRRIVSQTMKEAKGMPGGCLGFGWSDAAAVPVPSTQRWLISSQSSRSHHVPVSVCNVVM